MNDIKHLPYEIDPNANRDHYYETLWKKTAIKLLEDHVQTVAGLSLLDYGCGRGETMGLAREAGMIPFGTDMDPNCVELASKYGGTKILDPADPVSSFGEKSFDVVACFHVLEHVPSPLETLVALRDIARQYLLIAVPNLSRPRDFIRRRNWDGGVNSGHLQSWDHAHFRNLAEKHANLEVISWGFDVVKIPPFSNLASRLFGQRAAVWLETGVFKRMYPYGSNSVIALCKPRA